MGFAHGFGGGFCLVEVAAGGVAALGRDFGGKGAAAGLDVVLVHRGLLGAEEFMKPEMAARVMELMEPERSRMNAISVFIMGAGKNLPKRSGRVN